MKRLLLAIAVYCLFAHPALAKCDVQLKPSDGFKELSAKLQCLKAEISELRNVIFPQGATRPALPTPVAGAAQESGGVRVELEKCSGSGGSVDCKIHLTSLTKDQTIYMSGDVIAVDNNGVTYRWRGFQKVGEKHMESGGNSRWYVAGVRTAATISYGAQTDQSPSQLAALQLWLRTDGSQYRLITFRNVALR